MLSLDKRSIIEKRMSIEPTEDVDWCKSPMGEEGVRMDDRSLKRRMECRIEITP